jgi:hypothetical protein
MISFLFFIAGVLFGGLIGRFQDAITIALKDYIEKYFNEKKEPGESDGLVSLHSGKIC